MSTTNPPSLVCPVTHETFKNPVTAPSGHTYERSAAEKCKKDPLTREKLKPEQLVENHAVRNCVQELEEARAKANIWRATLLVASQARAAATGLKLALKT